LRDPVKEIINEVESMKGTCLALVLALMAMCVPAGAYPNFFGSTGLVQIPTADTAERGVYEFGIDYAELGSSGQNAWPVRLVAGTSERAELGAAFMSAHNSTDARIVSLGGKVALRREPADPFSLSIGATLGELSGEVFTATDLDRAIRVYGVVTKDLTGQLEQQAMEQPAATVRGHVGLVYTRLENMNASTTLRPFAGLEFARRSGAMVGLEWDASPAGDDVTSVVVRTPLKGGIMTQIGLTNNLGGLDFSGKHGLFAGIVYRFGVVYPE
jgi:hypothetical protein